MGSMSQEATRKGVGMSPAHMLEEVGPYYLGQLVGPYLVEWVSTDGTYWVKLRVRGA